jgi:hypothetical protein
VYCSAIFWSWPALFLAMLFWFLTIGKHVLITIHCWAVRSAASNAKWFSVYCKIKSLLQSFWLHHCLSHSAFRSSQDIYMSWCCSSGNQIACSCKGLKWLQSILTRSLSTGHGQIWCHHGRHHTTPKWTQRVSNSKTVTVLKMVIINDKGVSISINPATDSPTLNSSLQAKFTGTKPSRNTTIEALRQIMRLLWVNF